MGIIPPMVQGALVFKTEIARAPRVPGMEDSAWGLQTANPS